MRGETGPDGQNIFGYTDVLINDFFCERQYLYVLRQQIKMTLTFLKILGYLLTWVPYHLKDENFATFTFIVKDMFNLQSKTSKDFLTSLSNCN